MQTRDVRHASLSRRPRRRLKAAASVSAVCVLAAGLGAAPAHAHDYKRPRSASMMWAPNVGIAEARVTTALSNTFHWQVHWQYPRDRQLKGAHRALELKAVTEASYADSTDGYMSHNFPSGSTVLTDTQALESPTDATREFGIVVGDTNYIQRGTDYWAELGVHKAFSSPTQFPITWRVNAATKKDHQTTGCFPNVSFCVFPDYSAIVVRPADFRVSNQVNKSYTWKENFLANYNMDDGSPSPWGGVNGSPVNYAGDSSAFTGQNYLSFKNQNGWGAVAQTMNKSTRAGENWTAEAVVRCADTYSSTGCPIRLEYVGVGNTDEKRVVDSSIPGNSQWYVCRIDLKHGEGNQGFARSHSQLRVQVAVRQANMLLHVDDVIFAPAIEYSSGGSGDSGAGGSVPGPVCTRVGVND